MEKNERAGLSKGEMEPDSFSTYPRDAIQCAFPRSPWRLRFVDRWLFHRLSIYLVQSLANRLGGYPSGVSVALSFLPRHRVRCLLSCGVRLGRGKVFDDGGWGYQLDSYGHPVTA